MVCEPSSRKNLFHLPLGKFHSNEFLFLSEIDTSFSVLLLSWRINQNWWGKSLFFSRRQFVELYLVNFEGSNELHMWEIFPRTYAMWWWWSLTHSFNILRFVLLCKCHKICSPWNLFSHTPRSIISTVALHCHMRRAIFVCDFPS